MSVLIKSMEMPTSCAVCPFENYGDCYGGKVKAIMDIDDYVSAGKRHPRCPLVEIPPHGRLIDADAPIPLVDTHGKNIEVTVAHIIENNLGIVNAIIESEAFR